MENIIEQLLIFTSSLNENVLFASKVIGFFLSIVIALFLIFLLVALTKKIFRGIKILLMLKRKFKLGIFTEEESDNLWSRCIETMVAENNITIEATAKEIVAISKKGKKRCTLHLERKEHQQKDTFEVCGTLWWNRKLEPHHLMEKQSLLNLASS